MPSKNEKLKPGKTLIYERANGVVYARYAEDPELPRWIIGGDPGAVARAQDQKSRIHNKIFPMSLDKIVVIFLC